MHSTTAQPSLSQPSLNLSTAMDPEDIPPLESFYTERWPGDRKADTNYFPEEHDYSLGSSDEWDGASESSLSSLDHEDSDANQDE